MAEESLKTSCAPLMLSASRPQNVLSTAAVKAAEAKRRSSREGRERAAEVARRRCQAQHQARSSRRALPARTPRPAARNHAIDDSFRRTRRAMPRSLCPRTTPFGAARRTMNPVKARAQVRRLPDRATAGFTCDFCGAAYERDERRQLVWHTGLGNEFVLADLCGRCAEHHDRLLKSYGGRGRESMALREAPTPAPGWGRLVGRAEFALLRGLIYLLIAFAFFLIVTFVTARN